MEVLSVIVPCYNEEMNIHQYYIEMEKLRPFFVKKGVKLEYFFIDDGSKDQTLEKIKQLVVKDKNVHFSSFSRNFGKEAAMICGMGKAMGDYITIMDVDLQDPPELLPEMFQQIKDGYDIVATRRVTRKGEPFIQSWFARRFYSIINKCSETEIADGARDFRIMTRQVVDSILSLPEYNRFSKGIFSWVGYQTKWIEFENIERRRGETKWSFWKLFGYAIEGITSFSTLPLLFSIVMGLFFCFLAFAAIVFIIVRTLAFGDPVGGWPSMVCIFLLVSGVQLFCIGILGQYMSKIYLETKHRPLYLVKEVESEKLRVS